MPVFAQNSASIGLASSNAEPSETRNVGQVDASVAAHSMNLQKRTGHLTASSMGSPDSLMLVSRRSYQKTSWNVSISSIRLRLTVTANDKVDRSVQLSLVAIGVQYEKRALLRSNSFCVSVQFRCDGALALASIPRARRLRDSGITAASQGNRP